MEEYRQNFLLKEYDKLSAELAKLLEETRTREKYSLTIIAALAAWIFTEAIKIKPPAQKYLIIHMLSCVPLVTTTMYGISVLLLYKNIKWIGIYLKKVETFILDAPEENSDWGWEHYFDKENKKRYFVIWTWILWILQLIIGAAIIYVSFSLK